MLTLFHDNKQYPLENSEYYIRELANGLDECIFSLNIHDPIYEMLAEEEQITDRGGQRYKVKQIDGGATDAKVVCQLDLDEWRASISINYNSGTKTCYDQIDAVKPAGWTIADRASINIGRTLEGDLTPLDVCMECTNVYGVYIRWDNKAKTVTIYPKTMGAPVGAFATRELNLKEINYKGKSNDIVTRLYAYGKDGLSFASINGGKAYVDNFTYTTQVICGIWRDDRYEVKQNLLDDAQAKLAVMSRPERSYECSIVDLQATNPELYNNLDFSIFTTATLIDDVKNVAIDYQVVERHVYPYHPEMNEVIFNSEPLKITAAVTNVVEAITSPNSTFQQIQAEKIKIATDWLTSGDGYVVAKKGANGQWSELLFMDTDDESTAQNVLRINTNGLGFSTTGINGPYSNAWTIDGNLVADFITTGTMRANRISGGTLTLGGNGDGNGICIVNNNSGTEKVRLDKNGLKAQAGYIGDGSNGWIIGTNNIHNGVTSFTDTTHEGIYIGVDGIRVNGRPTPLSPIAGTTIYKGGFDVDSTINAGGVSATNITANNRMRSSSYVAVDGTTEYTGVANKAIAWTGVDGVTHSLAVHKGIVTALT